MFFNIVKYYVLPFICGVSKHLPVCVSAGSVLPPQVSYPAGEWLFGYCDEWAQCYQQQQPLSAWRSGGQRPPVAQHSTDSGKNRGCGEIGFLRLRIF